MKKILFTMVALAAGSCLAQNNYPITPIPFTEVKITPETFWGQRLDASREVTIPLAFSKCEETGRYRNFELAAAQLKGQGSDTVVVRGFSFDDTDVYKTIEGCSYLLKTYPTLKLKIQRQGRTDVVSATQYMDSVIAIVAAAQEPDGYLNTARTMNPKNPHKWMGARRWEKVEELSHEFYNLGHMVEGAIAHYQATGKDNFLKVAKAYADCVCREIGPASNQQIRVPGHQIAEMALAKLFLVTGDKKYLAEAKFFLEKRGRTARTDAYSQAHQPVTEQSEAVGHAVRATYMYSGMADVGALTADVNYVKAIDRIWQNIVEKKMYITGGIGSTSNGEAFGEAYDLPNMSAYCETCAAIGNVYFNYRQFLLHGDAKYYDVLERTLYNGLLSGISLDGGSFFYPNPLESIGQHQRQAWFGCACCPSNVCRFIPSLPGYLYATRDNDLYFNLYVSNTAEFKVNGRTFEIEEVTDYPFSGYVKIFLRKARGAANVKLRIPGWLRNQPVPSDLYEYSDGKRPNFVVKINEKPVNVTVDKFGYVTLKGVDWRANDKIELVMDMEPRVVKANSKVEADLGRVAVERGPLVYCAEFADNPSFDVRNILLNQAPKFTTKDDKLFDKYNVTLLTTDAQVLLFNSRGELQSRSVQLNLIPYYAWNHRGPGSMAVWLPQDLRATTPVMPPTLASRSTVNASHKVSSISAINDRLVPKSENDQNIPYYNWFPKKGGMEFIEYSFAQATPVQSSTIYWFDDSPWGGCKVPKSWRLLYRAYDGSWKPVEGVANYPVKKGVANTVQFKQVTTTAIRLEVTQPDNASCGIYEWEIK
ncbi:MAG: glycoside hydrolase family 127 protein [Bacteroidales bacterium]|jgi:hypothetical protein|nr:glycoside hydrolase family 127 protein [Bacteroidales bacterium]